MGNFTGSRRPARVGELHPEEVRELMHFCRTYRWKREQADALLTLRISTPEPARLNGGKEGAFLPRARGGAPSDPVAETARRRSRYLRDVDMIDRAARMAARPFASPGCPADKLARLLTMAVTGQASALWVIRECSLGRNPFYAMRRGFFMALKELREAAMEGGEQT